MARKGKRQKILKGFRGVFAERDVIAEIKMDAEISSYQDDNYDPMKDGPLFVKDVLIYPNLTGEVSKSAKELGFFFTVYPSPTTSAPQAVLDVIQNGTRLADR